MYPITEAVKALFEAEQRKVLRITGGSKTPITGTSGPAEIASFDDAVAANALGVTVGIEPVQSGSGDPSPTNVRPISGWTGANIHVSPTQNAQDGQTYAVNWQTEAGTVYGGTLDVTNGVLTVDRAMVDLGTLTWEKQTYTDVGDVNFRATVNDLKLIPDSELAKMVCSAYKTVTAFNITHSFENGTIASRSNVFAGVRVCDHRYYDSTAAEFKAAMSGVQLVYELATPVTYQLTPTQIALLAGVNNVWADCGETTVEYATGYNYEINITDDNVMVDSFQIDRYSCNGEKLEVGTAIAAQLSFNLENIDGTYDDVVFEGTELFAEVGIADWAQDNPAVHWVPCGYFTPDEQPRRMSTISITALDRMTKFDVVVDVTDLSFPTTIAGLVGQACTVCGVTLAQSIAGLTNADVAVSALPTVNGEITYRNLVQWCAGIMGTNAWIDWNGELRFSWYNNATGYVSTMDNRYNSDLYENDLTVTGVEYTNDSGIAIVEGTDDYAIDLTGNAIAGPLIATVLPALNTALNGFTYRPFTAAAVNAPYLWPMDVVTFTDKGGHDHTGVLTNVCFGLNGTTALESRGMTYAINKAAQPKGFTREQAQLITEAMNQVETDIDDSLTQQEIFNRLTDDGAAQGLVLYNGQLYINASYINAGELNARYINFNAPVDDFDIPDENDPDSLLDGQAVVDGWIVNTSGTGSIVALKCDYAKLLRGRTIALTFTYNGTLNYCEFEWASLDGGGGSGITEPVIAPNPYTYTFVVPDEADSFELMFDCSGLKQISATVSGPQIVYPDDIQFTYAGLQVGSFLVDRSGNLNAGGISIFKKWVKFNGDVSFASPGAVRASLDVYSKGEVDDRILAASQAISIPAAGSSVSRNMAGLTSDHELVRWNFSSSAENAPPADLTWTTNNGYFTISNTGGTTSESIRPVFALPEAVAITTR